MLTFSLQTHSLRVYLHIITLAYINSTWVEPQHTQPPWTLSTEFQEPQNQLWFWFIGLCVQFSGNPVDFWDAQALFRLLLPVLSHKEAASLFRSLDSKINGRDYSAYGRKFSTEEGLIAGLSITTAYIRHLIARDDRTVYTRRLGDRREGRYLARRLIQDAQTMLDKFERIVDVDCEFNDTKTRQFLELNLAVLEMETSLATDEGFYHMFESHDGIFQSHDNVRNHTIWKIADRNDDLAIQAAFLRIPYLGLRGTNLNRLTDVGLPKHLIDLMGDSMGYLNSMTDRILSVYRLSIMRNPPKTPPTAQLARVHTGTVYKFMNDSDGAEASSFEYFRNLLSSFDVPFIKFNGSFAVTEPTASRLKTPEEILAEPPEVVTKNQLTVDKDASETPWPMHYATEKGYREMVKNLLELNVDANARDINGRTPLVIAAKNGDVEIAKLLLDNKADVEARDGDLHTPLIISVNNNDIDMATLLLHNKADARARFGKDQVPMNTAVWNRNEAMVKLLLDNKVDIEAKGVNGETPLITAIRADSAAMVKFLLDNKADIEAKVAYEKPLVAGVHSRRVDIVTLLLQRKADASVRDNLYRTPLIMAVVYKNLDIVTALLGHPGAIPKDSEEELKTEASKAGGDIERLVKSALDSRVGLEQSSSSN